MAGAGARGMIAVAFGLGPEDAGFGELREEFFSNYESRMTENTLVFDGVAELIARIGRAGLKWGVVTNKSARFTVPLTKAMPLFDTAQAIISGDTTPYAKPHPAPLLEAARQLDLSPEHCIYVGDDERDIVAGRAAGMPTVAAAYGYLGKTADTAGWKADATIASPGAHLNFLRMA
jgi:phosphoglycolate phosphatase